METWYTFSLLPPLGYWAFHLFSSNIMHVFHVTKFECWLNYLHFVCAGIQKSLRSDFDMAYERGRISVSAEDGNTPPTFTRVSTAHTSETHMRWGLLNWQKTGELHQQSLWWSCENKDVHNGAWIHNNSYKVIQVHSAIVIGNLSIVTLCSLLSVVILNSYFSIMGCLLFSSYVLYVILFDTLWH